MKRLYFLVLSLVITIFVFGQKNVRAQQNAIDNHTRRLDSSVKQSQKNVNSSVVKALPSLQSGRIVASPIGKPLSAKDLLPSNLDSLTSKTHKEDDIEDINTKDFVFAYFKGDSVVFYTDEQKILLIGNKLQMKMKTVDSLLSDTSHMCKQNGILCVKTKMDLSLFLKEEKNSINQGNTKYLLYDSEMKSYLNILKCFKKHGITNKRIRTTPCLHLISCMKYCREKERINLLLYKHYACISENSMIDSDGLVEVEKTTQTKEELDSILLNEYMKEEIYKDTIKSQNEYKKLTCMSAIFYDAFLEQKERDGNYILLDATPFSIYLVDEGKKHLSNDRVKLMSKNQTYPYGYSIGEKMPLLRSISKLKLQFSQEADTYSKDVYIDLNIPKCERGLYNIDLDEDANASIRIILENPISGEKKYYDLFDIL